MMDTIYLLLLFPAIMAVFAIWISYEKIWGSSREVVTPRLQRVCSIARTLAYISLIPILSTLLFYACVFLLPCTGDESGVLGHEFSCIGSTWLGSLMFGLGWMILPVAAWSILTLPITLILFSQTKHKM